jgi:hypothetical protein
MRAFPLPNVKGEPRPRLARAVLLGARVVTAVVVGSGALLARFLEFRIREARDSSATNNSTAFLDRERIPDRQKPVVLVGSEKPNEGFPGCPWRNLPGRGILVHAVVQVSVSAEVVASSISG